MLRLRQVQWLKWVDRLAHWSYLIVVFSLALWFLLGLVAALLGGEFTRLGDGFGGAWGVADLTLILAMLLALPSFVVGFVGVFRQSSGSAKRMLAYVFPLIISVGYVLLAHWLDPCFRGVWTSFSRFGAVPLCEYFGFELNIHTRFHLLWHVLPTLPLVLVYWLLVKRHADSSVVQDVR